MAKDVFLCNLWGAVGERDLVEDAVGESLGERFRVGDVVGEEDYVGDVCGRETCGPDTKISKPRKRYAPSCMTL